MKLQGLSLKSVKTGKVLKLKRQTGKYQTYRHFAALQHCHHPQEPGVA